MTLPSMASITFAACRFAENTMCVPSHSCFLCFPLPCQSEIEETWGDKPWPLTADPGKSRTILKYSENTTDDVWTSLKPPPKPETKTELPLSQAKSR